MIGFDEDPITLGGVKEGTIVGTVVQQPYEWGYQGMKDMAKFLEGDKSFIPANKLIIILTKIIDQSNVDAFAAELKQRQGKRSGDGAGPCARHCPAKQNFLNSAREGRLGNSAGCQRFSSREMTAGGWSRCQSRSSNSPTSPRPIRASRRSHVSLRGRAGRDRSA